MKTAFAYWEDRIAPVFDVARQIHVVESESGRIVAETEEVLAEDLPAAKAIRLADLAIGTLVCGAISRPLQDMVAAYGITVVPFVAGDLGKVVQAWLRGKLGRGEFVMPGCCGRGRRLRRGTTCAGAPGRGGQAGDKGRGHMISRAGTATAVGACLCPRCGRRESHERGLPCVERRCPKCGTAMIRESGKKKGGI